MTVLGTSLSRVEGRLKVTGAASYVGDHAELGMAHAVLVASTVAKGRVRRLDADAAIAVSGVRLIIDHRNTLCGGEVPKALTGNGGIIERRVPLGDDRIHYAGQPVALVIADTLAQATEAASLVRVEYDVEPWRLRLEDGLAEAAHPDLFAGEPGLQHSSGDAAAALARAPVVLEARYTTPVEHHAPIEVPAAVAHWDGDALTVHSATRNLSGTKAVLAGVFAIPPEKVRVVCTFVGGAFGSKGFLFDYAILAAMAAKAAGRPAKLVFSRRGMFEDHGHRPRTVINLALGAEQDGRLTAIRQVTDTQTSELSDYTEPVGRTAVHLYACPNMDISNNRVEVNASTPCPMRAPGEAPGGFAIESAMDELAVKLSMDPIELRLRNLPDRDPLSGKPWSTYNLADCWAEGRRRFGWERRTAAPGSMRNGGDLVGYGVATAVYPALKGKAGARATLRRNGRVTLASGTHDAGHGTYSVMTQIGADALGLPVDRVVFELGDTRFPEAPASGGSRTTSTVGSAVVMACQALTAELARRASADPASPLAGLDPSQIEARNGRLFERAFASRGESWTRLMERAGLDCVEAEARFESGKEDHALFSFGAHFVEVRVDPVTRRLRVKRYVGVFDPGRILNPKQARSQILSGVTFGLGMALTELGVHDASQTGGGRLVTASLGAYHVPVAADIPAMDVHFLDRPDPVANVMGARGLGEIGIVGLPGAIANAVYHATGKRVRDLPIHVERLL